MLRKLFCLIVSGTFFIAPSFAQNRHVKDNSDRILNYTSVIDVKSNGDMLVKETITVFNGDGSSGMNDKGEMVESHNNSIEKGIFREFPTRYKDKSGFFVNKGFQVVSVSKNGVKEPYATESLTNGVRVKIGNKDITLDPGMYVYEIDYKTDRQLLFLEDKDELYWNVNGNGWIFSADTVSCEIHFPEGALIKEQACYTGVQGAVEHNCTSKTSGDNTIYFHNTAKLGSYEGLTISAAIQKGIISPPGTISNAISFLRSNYIIPALAAIIFFLFTFYYIIWSKKGRDPEKGIIYPQFSPPPNLSPADCGYIIEQQYGPHLFTATLVDFAVKKYLKIEITREGLVFKTNVYNFVKPEGNDPTPVTFDTYGFNVTSLYGETARKGTFNMGLKSLYDALSATLADRFQIRNGKQNKVYGLFRLNKGYTQFGFFVIIAALFLSVQFLVQHLSLKLAVITGTLMVILFIIHNIFTRIMSAYTRQGRDIVDHLLGFKMYLETAEQHVYQQLTPPEKTLDLFEKYLPYAIALKVENAWAGKFEDIMQKALEQGYNPTYYSMNAGGLHSFSMSDMSQGISSGLSNTVSSASTPPSSSGSSGGGSSGGGGGGGGGGGW